MCSSTPPPPACQVKKTAFAQGVRCASLGSRRTLCGNERVSSLKTDGKMRDACLEMQKNKKKSRKDRKGKKEGEKDAGGQKSKKTKTKTKTGSGRGIGDGKAGVRASPLRFRGSSTVVVVVVVACCLHGVILAPSRYLLVLQAFTPCRLFSCDV